MQIKENHIGKIIDSKTMDVIGIVFCVLWRGRKVYITSTDVVPSGNQIVKKVLSWVRPSDIMFEDSFGNIVSMRLVRSEGVIGYMGRTGGSANIAIFEIYGDQKFNVMPIDIAKDVQCKITKANLLSYVNDIVTGLKCKILCSGEAGFIQVTDKNDLQLKGSPIISPGAGKLLGFYSNSNFKRGAKTLKAGNAEDVRTQDDFTYNGNVTTVQTIKRLLKASYGPDHQDKLTW